MPETMDGTTITNGELNRAVNMIRGDIRDLKTDVNTRPTTKDLSYLEARIKDLEDFQKWAFRVGIPSLIMVVVNTANTIKGVQ